MIRTALLATVLAFTLPYAQPWRTDAPPIQQAGTTVTACDLDPYTTCTTTTESTTWTPTPSSSPSETSSSSEPPSPSSSGSTASTTGTSESAETPPSPTTNDSSPASSEITAPPPPPSNGPCTSTTVPVETGGAATIQSGDCSLTVDVGTLPADAVLGYFVAAKRPDIRRPGEFEYAPAGSVWSTIGPSENHQSYCEGMAVRRDDTEVTYPIVAVVPADRIDGTR